MDQRSASLAVGGPELALIAGWSLGHHSAVSDDRGNARIHARRPSHPCHRLKPANGDALRRITQSPFGMVLQAIRENEGRTRAIGYSVERYKVVAVMLSGVFAGLAGVMEFSKLSVGDPTVAVGLELDVIAAVIIGGGSLLGGRGSIFGTLIGATIMAVIQLGSSQRGLPNWVQQIVTGIIIILAVALDHWRQHGHNNSRS